MMKKEEGSYRYVAYAFGEFVLIVAGILLAMHINDWNENRKLEKERTFVVSELMGEFENNLAALELSIDSNYILYEKLKSISASIESPDKPVNSYILTGTFREWFNLFTFNPSQGLINSMVNTSSFHHIHNIELRKLLMSWSGYYEDYKENENGCKDERKDMSAFLSGYIDFQKPLDPANPGNAINALEFKNRMYWYGLTFQAVILEAEYLAEIIQQILALLQEELK